MSSVVFNPRNFKDRYPEFEQVPDQRLRAFFDNDAILYLSNESDSPVQDLQKRASLLNMLVAHIAYLAGVLSADGLPEPVGRASQATEGSVSTNFEDLTPGTAAWFQQTQYGAAFWQATNYLRGFRYIINNNYRGFRGVPY